MIDYLRSSPGTDSGCTTPRFQMNSAFTHTKKNLDVVVCDIRRLQLFSTQFFTYVNGCKTLIAYVDAIMDAAWITPCGASSTTLTVNRSRADTQNALQEHSYYEAVED